MTPMQYICEPRFTTARRTNDRNNSKRFVNFSNNIQRFWIKNNLTEFLIFRFFTKI
ncbi:hypothetical protein GLOIN_2v1580751 [Rhizophagus irregularis DAOM 181602=DAOM 197198]|uniref:Uncharacterized protein n=1 Tax=Rhizophagus irregularis (strain DAOM 181602 / DAOM 197198 / MUCL 43194) TaxID=747089 RepID=A0A2P4Q8F6_RHIID|nr:hypothetical protein GLOIN_2v1580751 [Rhizophagus irregularis DAOM 181602=DAOM 197198]POG73921.1 hypothetical protein GLOIN_2v1580751 [Rhizophagus irregularis DAOM 181602=DAOM 197198]|eukprot:XP_025180787.1 hypothetical protein GLOIN_2v1580751 [Rhizophagus irregularis DAOM 181602=DAOM 197198]